MNRNRVRELREKKSWSQDHLAEATGLSLRTIQRAENGKNISKETKLNIAAAFDIPVAELNGNEYNFKFLILKLILSMAIILSIMISWFFYGQELFTQNQYFLNYKIFLMVLSLITGIAWGIGNAWYLHRHQNYLKDILQFGFGCVILFVTFNLMPFIKYPHDQYSAAFPWLVTGLMPLGISWTCLLWFQGDMKKILANIHISLS